MMALLYKYKNTPAIIAGVFFGSVLSELII
jgi:hypothetical protein